MTGGCGVLFSLVVRRNSTQKSVFYRGIQLDGTCLFRPFIACATSNAGHTFSHIEAVEQHDAVLLGFTGSKATRLRGIPFDQSHRVFDSDTINVLNFLPRSIVVAGLGIIGIEFANIFRTLGVDVKVVVRGSTEAAMKKLRMDMDVAAELIRLLEKSGVQILEGTTIEEFVEVPAPGDAKSFIKMAL